MQERSIRVFYHVSMMNHYLDVVKEQMDLMVDSGLDNIAIQIKQHWGVLTKELNKRGCEVVVHGKGLLVK